MVSHRTGRSFHLYFLFALFSAAWLATVFLYYGSFAPADPGRHKPSPFHLASNHQFPATNDDNPRIIIEPVREVGVELREPQSTKFKNAEKAPTIESNDESERKNSISNTNDNSDSVASNLALLDAASAKNTSPPVASEKPKDIKAPILSLAPIKVAEKHGIEAISNGSPNLTKDPPAVPNTFTRSTTVIIILACKRPHYLEQTLNSLMRLEGVGEYTIVISQDGHEQGVRDLAASFVNRHPNIRYANNALRQDHEKKQGAAALHYIADHYKFALGRAFEEAGTRHAIVLEEDMLLSPDFLRLFESTAYLLDADPSLMCVSSWNDNGYKHMDLDPTRVFRSSFFPGLGWMLKRELWTDELSSKWPPHSWDHWMRVDGQSKGRDCLVPELSRNHNIGEEGATVNRADFASRLSNVAFAASAPAGGFRDLDGLREDRYRDMVTRMLDSAEEVPRGGGLGPPGAGRTFRVGYVREEWRRTAEVYGLYISSWPRAHFRRVTIMRRNGNTVLLYDRRLSPLAPAGARIDPGGALQPTAAPQGVSCERTCGAEGMRCEGTWFDFVNSCAALGRAFPCPKGCAYEVGEDIPVLVSDPAHPTHGFCLVTDALPTCPAAHPATSRLCPCARG